MAENPLRTLRFWYRWHRCEVYYRRDAGWVGWARRYPDRTTDYCAAADDAKAATRDLVDATLRERKVRWLSHR